MPFPERPLIFEADLPQKRNSVFGTNKESLYFCSMMLKYDKTGIYKINVTDSADVLLIEFGFTSVMKPLGGSGSCENYLIMVGDLIIGWDFQIDANDNVIQTVGMARFNVIVTPVFQYKQFLTCWGGSYGNEYHMTYLLTPYLATINNLSSAVIKNADKTMKITYTLTEEDA